LYKSAALGMKQAGMALRRAAGGPDPLDQIPALAQGESRRNVSASYYFLLKRYHRRDANYDLSQPGLTDAMAALERQGFEVGVHDLHRDGKLYRSRKTFQSAAPKINQYLTSWGAVGFRSGFMLHDLRWLLDLNILYDASTFDTDPFEPQPDGVNTIFPFWVPGEDGAGYVELPCTLPQDFTLFILLRETAIDVWKSKLEWVAAHGRLALVNAHPDYMSFDRRRSASEYGADLYKGFLEHVTQRYRKTCWFALPRDVANYVCQHRSALPARTLRV